MAGYERRTANVADIRETANRMLADSVDTSAAERRGIAALLEAILMDANAYHGFRYLGVSEERDERGYPVSLGDETRREYF